MGELSRCRGNEVVVEGNMVGNMGNMGNNSSGGKSAPGTPRLLRGPREGSMEARYWTSKYTCTLQVISQCFAGVSQQHPQPFHDLRFVRAAERAVAALVEEQGQHQPGFQPGWWILDNVSIVRWTFLLVLDTGYWVLGNLGTFKMGAC